MCNKHSVLKNQIVGEPTLHARPLKFALLSLCLTLAISIASPVVLANDGASNREQAVKIATERSGGGKVLSVKTEQSKNSGQTVFAVKILKNGRVKVIRIKKLNQ